MLPDILQSGNVSQCIAKMIVEIFPKIFFVSKEAENLLFD